MQPKMDETLNKSLFHMSQEYVELEGSLLNDPDNEGIEDRLEISEKELLGKAENYHKMIRKHSAIEATISTEIKRLQELLPKHKGIQSRLKNSLLNAVIAYGPIDGDTWRISSGSSKRLEVFDETQLPPWYFENEKKVKMADVKKAIQDGTEEIKGARIIESTHLLMK